MEAQLGDKSTFAFMALRVSEPDEIPIAAWDEISSDSRAASVEFLSRRTSDNHETWRADT